MLLYLLVNVIILELKCLKILNFHTNLKMLSDEMFPAMLVYSLSNQSVTDIQRMSKGVYEGWRGGLVEEHTRLFQRTLIRFP